MRTRLVFAAILAVGALAAGGRPARAQANNCMYSGREYPEGVVICQAGLRNLCMNGEWQSKGFCNGTPDGGIIGGAVAGPQVIEVPVPVPAPPPAAEADDD